MKKSLFDLFSYCSSIDYGFLYMINKDKKENTFVLDNKCVVATIGDPDNENMDKEIHNFIEKLKNN